MRSRSTAERLYVGGSLRRGRRTRPRRHRRVRVAARIVRRTGRPDPTFDPVGRRRCRLGHRRCPDGATGSISVGSSTRSTAAPDRHSSSCAGTGDSTDRLPARFGARVLHRPSRLRSCRGHRGDPLEGLRRAARTPPGRRSCSRLRRSSWVHTDRPLRKHRRARRRLPDPLPARAGSSSRAATAGDACRSVRDGRSHNHRHRFADRLRCPQRPTPTVVSAVVCAAREGVWGIAVAADGCLWIGGELSRSGGVAVDNLVPILPPVTGSGSAAAAGVAAAGARETRAGAVHLRAALHAQRRIAAGRGVSNAKATWPATRRFVVAMRRRVGRDVDALTGRAWSSPRRRAASAGAARRW